MHDKPILLCDCEKAVTEVPIVPFGVFHHCFFELATFEVETGLPLVILFGYRVERRCKGNEGLRKCRSTDSAYSDGHENADNRGFHATLPQIRYLKWYVGLKEQAERGE